MSALLIAIVYGVAATIALGFYSVYDWLDPMFPAYLGLAGVFIPSILIVVALEPSLKKPLESKMLIAQMLLVAAIFGFAVPSLWKSPDVRLQVVSLIPSTRSIDRAMDDPHEKVQRTACWMMFDPRFEFKEDEIVTALASRPRAATTCLAEVTNEELRDAVIGRLYTAWHRALMTSPEGFCELAGAVDSLTISETDRVTTLLDCAVHAEGAEPRQCCTDRLATVYKKPQILQLATKGSTDLKQMETTGWLVAAAFAEPKFTKENPLTAGKLGLDSPEFRRLAPDLACEAIVEGEDFDNGPRFMEWMFTGSQVCIDDEVGKVELEVRAACVEFLSNGERHEHLDDALCEADRAVRQRRLEEAAKARGGQALEVAGASSAIELGGMRSSRRRANLEEYVRAQRDGTAWQLSSQEEALMFDQINDSRPEDMFKTNMRPSADEVQRQLQQEESGFGMTEGELAEIGLEHPDVQKKLAELREKGWDPESGELPPDDDSKDNKEIPQREE